MHTVNVEAQDLFQSLSDITRVRIVRLLADSKEEACLCELSESLREPSYKLSRHVKILKQNGLVSSKKEGRWIYHSLVRGPGFLEHLYGVVSSLPDTHRIFAGDSKRFSKRQLLRTDGRCCEEPSSKKPSVRS